MAENRKQEKDTATGQLEIQLISLAFQDLANRANGKPEANGKVQDLGYGLASWIYRPSGAAYFYTTMFCSNGFSSFIKVND